MESPDIPTGKSPRRDLQGPRPAPLRVRKHSHKIRKPVAPPPQPQPPAQYRPPVIIYTVSPKVIHVNPNEFMPLVQRLTGLSSSSSSAASSTGAVSPAARLAAIEMAAESPEKKKKEGSRTGNMGGVEGVEIDWSSSFPGILSPGPASLQPIPASFFSPPSDSLPPNFFHDLISPAMQGNRSYLEGTFRPSPSTFVSSYMTYPPPSPDFFNNFYNL